LGSGDFPAGRHRHKNNRWDVRIRLQTPAFAVIAILSGLIVLLGYFVDIPVISNLRDIFQQWAVVLTAIALGVGVLNLLSVHAQKIRSGTSGRINSLLLVGSFLATFLIALFWGLTSSASIWIFKNVLYPVEASLLAVLAILLIYAIGRMFSRGLSAFNLVFTFTVVFMLGVTALLSWVKIPLIGELRDWISQVLSLAGARAILIGVSLGAIAAGLRVLIGVDRPYEV
jgi:hypothetical protein